MHSEWISDRTAKKRLDQLLVNVHAGDRITASKWFGRIAEGDIAPSSNVEAQNLPFQRWYRFKEAFSPRFVSSAIGSLSQRPHACVDPFGGSGTTALACQFLGVRPATIEVNPFLADLIEAKLCRYDVAALTRDYARVLQAARELRVDPVKLLKSGPATMVEPGVDSRWIFNKNVAKKLLAYREAIATLDEPSHRRLFRVLLGSIAIGLSNVVISGKGRRYRSGWEDRPEPVAAVDRAFRQAAERAIEDVARFGRRAEHQYVLLRGDSRKLAGSLPEAEFALFSPPYPNSFDYTDIYNVELWLLGYLTSSNENRSLREATLRSHVQVKRSYDCDPISSPLLRKTVRALRSNAARLWDGSIPEMVQAYFGDMASILTGLAATMSRRADIMMVVGDSRYAGVHVDVAEILAELAKELSFEVKAVRPIRAMRASAQQGGHHVLSESLVHLRRRR
ncbi:hypothetical protein [Bradyrhizobium sp. USDA 3650]